MRHRRNNNKNKKQDGSQGRDVDEWDLVDEIPGSTVSDSTAVGRIDNAGSALVDRGSARIGRHKEDEDKEDVAGSALSVKQLRHKLGLTSSHEENIATGDVLVGLCYFPNRIRQMLCSYLDQAITQTSLFV